MDIMFLQELFQHLPGRNQEIAITALTSELKGILGRCFCTSASVQSTGPFERRRNRDLQFTLDMLNNCVELRGSTDAGKLGAGWYSHIRLERNMVLVKYKYPCDA